ncbi:MAG: GNAT family N-acetyltransferase [Bacillota bacterium]|nr:GNAT family N-acetyltransferase [Bacillota bacterium]
MNYIIREIQNDEIPLLEDFLYEAIFIPDWYTDEIPRDIIYTNPQMYAAIKDFGTLTDDYCLVAEVKGSVSGEKKIVGAVWVRIVDEYGHLDDETPSFSIALYKEYRGQGIGTALMEQMLKLLMEKGYRRASLGVNKENYAVRMYQKVGFKIVGDGADETEYLMICDLQSSR